MFLAMCAGHYLGKINNAADECLEGAAILIGGLLQGASEEITNRKSR
jgi:hypothetical protein